MVRATSLEAILFGKNVLGPSPVDLALQGQIGFRRARCLSMLLHPMSWDSRFLVSGIVHDLGLLLSRRPRPFALP